MSKENGKFEIGDKVFCLINGNGVILDVINDYCIYPILAKFNDEGVAYTEDGKYLKNSLIPTLYHGQDLQIIVKESEYEYKIACIYLGYINISNNYYKSIDDFIEANRNNAIDKSKCELVEISKRLVK